MLRCNGVYFLVLFTWMIILSTSNGWSANRRNSFLQDEAVDSYYDNIQNGIIDDGDSTWQEQEAPVKQKSSDSVDEAEMNKHLQDLPKNDELFEGDMVMDDRLRDAVLGVSKKSVITLQGIKWPDNTLNYDVDPNFTEEGKKLLAKAIHEFETRTCIKFRKRTTEPNYVYYTSEEDVCSSNIGMTGSKQKIHIGVHCMVLGTVLHETMHSLGFIHEHSRPDRDDYINVKWKNIKKDEWNNFNKYTFADVNNNGVRYNFASVMHYRNDAFTKNGDDTLIARDEDELKFGQRIKFSIGDVEGINHFYDCANEMATPNYNGLFKDYSGQKDALAVAEKKSEKLRRIFRNRLFDSRRNNWH